MPSRDLEAWVVHAEHSFRDVPGYVATTVYMLDPPTLAHEFESAATADAFLHSSRRDFFRTADHKSLEIVLEYVRIPDYG